MRQKHEQWQPQIFESLLKLNQNDYVNIGRYYKSCYACYDWIKSVMLCVFIGNNEHLVLCTRSNSDSGTSSQYDTLQLMDMMFVSHRPRAPSLTNPAKDVHIPMDPFSETDCFDISCCCCCCYYCVFCFLSIAIFFNEFYSSCIVLNESEFRISGI